MLVRTSGTFQCKNVVVSKQHSVELNEKLLCMIVITIGTISNKDLSLSFIPSITLHKKKKKDC